MTLPQTETVSLALPWLGFVTQFLSVVEMAVGTTPCRRARRGPARWGLGRAARAADLRGEQLKACNAVKLVFRLTGRLRRLQILRALPVLVLTW